MTLAPERPAPARPTPKSNRLVDQFELGLDAPICLTWELTYACNLECAHCLSSSGRRDPRELTTEQAEAVIAGIRKRAWDANHNCTAMVTGLLVDDDS